MTPSTPSPQHDLELIRDLMQRAKAYRHLPPAAPLLGGLLSLAGSWWTHLCLSQEGGSSGLLALGILWGGIFVVTLAVQLGLSYRLALRQRDSFWTPLTADIVHTLWPSGVAAIALTIALVRAGVPALIPSTWMLCYGAAGIAASAYAQPSVRKLGVAFVLAGVCNLVRPLPPALALGLTFGGFHLLYGAALHRRRTRAQQ